MKTLITTACLVLFVVNHVFSQNGTKFKADITSVCAGPIENEAIMLCNSFEDTLSLDLLEECDSLAVSSFSNQQIISFGLAYQSGTDLFTIQTETNSMPAQYLMDFKSSGEKMLIVENVIGKENGNYLYLGYRRFHFY